MSADEFDTNSASPSPAYDRSWRHPSEIADAARVEHLASTPPVSRRLTALTATVSIVASLTVLAIAIPKGITAYRDDVEPVSIGRETISPVKNFLTQNPYVLMSNKGETSALHIGHNCWIVALEAIDPAKQMYLSSASNSHSSATLLATDETAGVAIVKANTEIDPTDSVDPASLVSPTALMGTPEYLIADSFLTQHFLPSISFNNATKDLPIDTDVAIRGIASVVDKGGRMVGIVVRRKHATWMLNENTIRSILTNANIQK